MFEHPAFDDHEQLIVARDPESGLRALIGIHSTVLGPAFGGCRMHRYGSEDAALEDVLRLSRGMTYKAAICDLPLGGGKAVIIGEPKQDKTPALLRSMARVIDGWHGRFVVADDVGTTLADLAVMRDVTPHTAAATLAAQQPLAVTAYGVLAAMRAAVRRHLGWDSLSGLRVAVQGLGNVGFPLCGYLRREGAELVAADLDRRRADRAHAAFGARIVPPDQVLDQEVDVLSPCALGNVLDEVTAERIRARIICGGANEQLSRPDIDRRLQDRGILYVPDYVANAGGMIDFHQERLDDRPEAVLRAVARIGEITTQLLDEAALGGRTCKELADARVRERLAAGRRARAA
ncbi:MAG TPA: Glu/Leu/Phe/Val dehydrogenase dimerization domain-containing protein [Geminicoccaceae bacterium]